MQGRERCAWDDAAALKCWQASTDKKALRNFWKSELKVIFDCDKYKRVKVKYETNAREGG